MAEGQERVRVDSLSIPELQQLRDRVNADIQRLGEGSGQLQGFLATMSSSMKAITNLSASAEGKVESNSARFSVIRSTWSHSTVWFSGQKILLPLTSSLYVPGELASKEHILVDIGTGYYVEVGAG
jgi:prefoldin alpha subunit